MKALTTEMKNLRVLGGNNTIPDGAYRIPHFKIDSYYFQVVASTGMDWDHVSVCMRHMKNGAFIERTCTWAEMCWIKDFFFDKEETVIQYHPAESNYVNRHPYVLHLWRPQNIEMPTPETIMV